MLALVLLALLLLLLGVRRPPVPVHPASAPSPRPRSRPPFSAAERWPPAAVLLPVAGEVPELDAVLQALWAQDYPEFEVVIISESDRERAGDPGEVAVRLAAREHAGLPPAMRIVRAERAVASSQKCANLVAGLAAASSRAEVVALLDADALPHRSWLRDLVRPLIDRRGVAGTEPGKPAVTTGFRWYLPGKTGAGLVRSAFSAAALAVVADPGRAFAWGGSLAMTRRDLQALAIPAAWSTALSDDLAVTRAVRAAGGEVHFVPECVLPSFGDPSWSGFSKFAIRQLTMLRQGSPRLWGEILAFHAALAVTQLGALAAALGWGSVPGGSAGRAIAFLLLAAPTLLAMGRTASRFGALRSRPLGRVAGWDRFRHLHVALSPLVTWIVLWAALIAGLRREVTWCGIRYRFRSGGVVEVAGGPAVKRHTA
jgi:hypothetical protein